MTLVDSTIASRDQILATIDEHADELRGLGAKSLALFGSMARGEGSDSSDIDMLVELQFKTFASTRGSSTIRLSDGTSKRWTRWNGWREWRITSRTRGNIARSFMLRSHLCGAGFANA